jgi:hypothetical protein
MTSLSSHRDAMTMSDQPAGPRRIRPWIETPAPGGFFRRPDLLEGRPVIGSPLRAEELGPVRALEAQVHLQTSVVRAAPVAPAPLESVDAEEGREMGRPLGPPPGRRRTPLPEEDGPLDVGHAHLAKDATLGRRPRRPHQPLPAPGRVLVAGHLAAEPFDRRKAPCLGCLSLRPCRRCLRPHSSLWGAGCARAAREQAGAGQDETPQKNTTPTVDCTVVGRSGWSRRPWAGQTPRRRGYALRRD